MKIAPPNHTQIPNSLLDEWMPILSDGEFKVLLCFCRKTFGWHKEKDEISLKQIAKATGLSKPSLPKIITRLIEKGLVKKTLQKAKNGSCDTNIYELVICAPEQGGSILGLPGVVFSDDQGVVILDDPQKKDSSKERHTKEREREPSPPLFKEFGSHGMVKMSDEEFSRLLKFMSEQERASWIEEIDLAILKMGEKEFNKKYKSHYATLLSWKRKADKTAPTSNYSGAKNQGNLSNATFAAKVKESLEKTGCKVKVETFTDSVHIVDGPYPPFVLKYTENGFEEQLLNRLKKMGINLKL